MFSSKNYSPQEVALITSLPVSILTGLSAYIYTEKAFLAAGTTVVLFLILYFSVLVMVRKFLYRKIKIIYKLIYQTKASRREEFYYRNILPDKSIEQVKEDVEKWAENRSAELELLRKTEAFRKEFLQNLSHELKTPIFAIQGYVDTLLNGAVEDSEVNVKFLGKASKNVDRLVNLVDDLDQITKLESGDHILTESIFIIQDLIKEVFESLSIKADEKNILCQIKKGCEIPINVYADREKIRTVLTNLIDNAIKYGKQDGQIEASIYRVDGQHVLVEISDDGYGIAEEHLSRIFERFYRTDMARSRKAGGSGLGLAICKHIIEAHNETIHVRSKIDVGSTFGFTLPKN
jgi:two-component system phosphate regulon sensor histidine kinase PhoR